MAVVQLQNNGKNLEALKILRDVIAEQQWKFRFRCESRGKGGSCTL
jgi:hypothetical protein